MFPQLATSPENPYGADNQITSGQRIWLGVDAPAERNVDFVPLVEAKVRELGQYLLETSLDDEGFGNLIQEMARRASQQHERILTFQAPAE